ncbi:hypothetical protein C8J57DRAFT_1071513 [Mycena rebaudengoi]|nr:hypothetical protein C8J57DRAFT_1071513 [Mycena rebaudengoi]
MGNLLAVIAPKSIFSTSIFPPSSKFDPLRDVPDLTGKITLVTGGNTGLGYETAKVLLLKGAKVYIAARSAEKANAAIAKLKEATNQTAFFLHLDLADLTSVQRAASAFLAAESRLDILYNNGGVMATPPQLVTAQNYDLQFGTNVIGHYLLTELLILKIPAFTASYQQDKTPARVIHVTSLAHNMHPTGGIEFASLEGGISRDACIKEILYGQSKLGNILVSNWTSRQYKAILVSCAVHPGTIYSGVARHLPSPLAAIGNALAGHPTPMGAVTPLWAGTTASAEEINGEYLIPWARVAPAGVVNTVALDLKLEAKLIVYLREQIKAF